MMSRNFALAVALTLCLPLMFATEGHCAQHELALGPIPFHLKLSDVQHRLGTSGLYGMRDPAGTTERDFIDNSGLVVATLTFDTQSQQILSAGLSSCEDFVNGRKLFAQYANYEDWKAKTGFAQWDTPQGLRLGDSLGQVLEKCGIPEIHANKQPTTIRIDYIPDTTTFSGTREVKKRWKDDCLDVNITGDGGYPEHYLKVEFEVDRVVSIYMSVR